MRVPPPMASPGVASPPPGVRRGPGVPHPQGHPGQGVGVPQGQPGVGRGRGAGCPEMGGGTRVGVLTPRDVLIGDSLKRTLRHSSGQTPRSSSGLICSRSCPRSTPRVRTVLGGGTGGEPGSPPAPNGPRRVLGWGGGSREHLHPREALVRQPGCHLCRRGAGSQDGGTVLERGTERGDIGRGHRGSRRPPPAGGGRGEGRGEGSPTCLELRPGSWRGSRMLPGTCPLSPRSSCTSHHLFCWSRTWAGDKGGSGGQGPGVPTVPPTQGGAAPLPPAACPPS